MMAIKRGAIAERRHTRAPRVHPYRWRSSIKHLVSFTKALSICLFVWQAGVVEMTWVMSDYTAANGQELTVSKGQQVEVIEICPTKSDYCLVRMPTRGTDHESVPEGLVPLSVLKQPPAPKSSPSKRLPGGEHDGGESRAFAGA